MKPRIRLWDENWECVYDSDTSDLTPEQFMVDHDWLNMSEDRNGGRKTGRLVNTDGQIDWHENPDYLRKIMNAPNPLLAPEYQFDNQSLWSLAAAPDPFPRQAGTIRVDAINRRIALHWPAESREAWERAEKLIFGGIVSQLRALGEAIAKAKPDLDALALALDDDQPPPPRADGKPHPPRPTRNPPMWAHDPTKSRRRR